MGWGRLCLIRIGKKAVRSGEDKKDGGDGDEERRLGGGRERWGGGEIR